jgi:glycosyltransferase involved in cell wall biosynthesis
MKPELSVVIPVYGCGPCLRELHRRLCLALDPLVDTFELIFVDDASRDEAWGALVELTETDPRVKAFGLSRNFGQDAAITAGLTQSSGRWTVVMDCDLQEPPEEIGRLYAKAQEGYQLVRTMRSRRGHSRLRRALSRAYRRLAHDSDTEYSNMSLLSRDVVEAFLSLNDRYREYTLILDWLGFRQAVVQINFAKREHGRSSYSVARLLRVALDGMFFRTTLLLRLVVLLGFLVALAGGILAAYNIVYYFVASQPSGYTSLVVLVLLSSGFIILSIGIVGLYVGRVFEQVKFRPLFIISRSAGVDLGEGFAEATPTPALGRDVREQALGSGDS